MSALSDLLARIAPERTFDATAASADYTLNTFRMDHAVIERWDAFTHCMARFHFHARNCILRITTLDAFNFEMEWGQCIRLLIEEYGREGEKAAFEISRTGQEGGLPAVCRAVARRMAEQYAENEIHARISYYLQGLTVEQKLAACDEYLARYGHLLPTELTEGTAGRIRCSFERVLQLHPRLMRNLGRVGRNGS